MLFTRVDMANLLSRLADILQSSRARHGSSVVLRYRLDFFWFFIGVTVSRFAAIIGKNQFACKCSCPAIANDRTRQGPKKSQRPNHTTIKWSSIAFPDDLTAVCADTAPRPPVSTSRKQKQTIKQTRPHVSMDAVRDGPEFTSARMTYFGSVCA